MGPEFPLQRITVTSSGYQVDPATSAGGDCTTRHPKDPARVARQSRVIPLITETLIELGECPDQE
jgi:hypothetical protein